MNAKEYNDFLVSAFKQQLEGGNTQLSTDAVLEYLKQHQREIQAADSPTQIDIKRYEAELQKWIEDCRSANESDLESVRATISAGQNALRSAFVMNGGAAVAILAFVGHLAAVNPGHIADFSKSMLWFVAGVGAISIASGTTYLSQWFYSDWEQRLWAMRAGLGINVISIILGLASYGLFIKGALVAYDAFLRIAA